jgi:hypothetical protein
MTEQPSRPSLVRTLFVVAAVIAALAVAVVASYAFLGSSANEPAHTMPNGQTMTGTDTMTGMEMP